MDDNQKFMRLFGSIFFSVGVLMFIIGIVVLALSGDLFAGGIPLLMGLIFGSIGGGVLISHFKELAKRKNITKNGQVYTGKIYGYIDDHSFELNGGFLVNTKVHYFDKADIEREAIIPTRFTKGTADFPIGATIDIIELDGKYTWVDGSVRFTHIDREEELLDDKPVAPDKINLVAVSCQGCGASYTAAAGYAARCPYCGGATNV